MRTEPCCMYDRWSKISLVSRICASGVFVSHLLTPDLSMILSTASPRLHSGLPVRAATCVGADEKPKKGNAKV